MMGFMIIVVFILMVIYYIQFFSAFLAIGKKKRWSDDPEPRFKTKQDIKYAFIPFNMWYKAILKKINTLE